VSQRLVKFTPIRFSRWPKPVNRESIIQFSSVWALVSQECGPRRAWRLGRPAPKQETECQAFLPAMIRYRTLLRLDWRMRWPSPFLVVGFGRRLAAPEPALARESRKVPSPQRRGRPWHQASNSAVHGPQGVDRHVAELRIPIVEQGAVGIEQLALDDAEPPEPSQPSSQNPPTETAAVADHPLSSQTTSSSAEPVQPASLAQPAVATPDPSQGSSSKDGIATPTTIEGTLATTSGDESSSPFDKEKKNSELYRQYLAWQAKQTADAHASIASKRKPRSKQSD
jgi:hypothetical protein